MVAFKALNLKALTSGSLAIVICCLKLIIRLTEILPHTTGLYTQFIKIEYLVENYLNLSCVIFHLNKCFSLVLALGRS